MTGLIAGVRQRPEQAGQFPRNWVHIGVSTGDRWIHIRQDKHHRWSLDEGQIHQYHLGGALHPHIRWWEAMQVPRRSIQFIEAGEGATLVSLVCEDLAQIDDVADVLRAVGPTLVVTPLLDGPQLSSRWAARYASVLADDPGSAVLTLTSYGMARRSRPHGQQASTIIALWKDTGRGTREIPLETGAHGVLISASGDRATRRSSDGRLPVANGSEFFNMSVYQVHAANSGSRPRKSPPASPARHTLDVGELTILTSWAEAVAEVLAATPEHVYALLDDADEHAPWRDAFAIAEPSEHLSRALQKLSRTVRAATADGDQSPEALLRALRDDEPDATGLPRLVRHVLRSAVEQRQLRQARSDGNVRTRG